MTKITKLLAATAVALAVASPAFAGNPAPRLQPATDEQGATATTGTLVPMYLNGHIAYLPGVSADEVTGTSAGSVTAIAEGRALRTIGHGAPALHMITLGRMIRFVS